MSNKERLNEFLKLYGYFLLPDIGVKEYGLSFSSTQKIVTLAKKLHTIISGGDIYMKREGQIIFESSSWHVTEKRKDEADIEYLERSINHTEQYLNRLPKMMQSESKYLFVIVFGDELHSQTDRKQKSCDIFFEYVESMLNVSFVDDAVALYRHGNRQMKINTETLPDGIILYSNSIESWLPPYQEENISDSEKKLIQELISTYFDKHSIVYGWI